MVEVLFLAVQESDFLVYSEFSHVDYSRLVLWFSFINLDVDVIWFYLFDSTHLIKPYAVTLPTLMKRSTSLIVLICNFGKEQYVLP